MMSVQIERYMKNSETGYFEWLYSKIENGYDYRTLCYHLYSIPFNPIHVLDKNRVIDGLLLREEFGIYLDTPCSIFEVMIGLALRCENEIMRRWDSDEDESYRWFAIMLESIGIAHMNGSNYDPQYVDEKIYILNNNLFERDGTGGWFKVENSSKDMRDLDVWYQLQAYLIKYC